MAKGKTRFDAQRIALCGLLVALMLVLGFIESLIPTGTIPGIKLGLSNGVLIFAVYMLGIPTAYALMLVKVVLSGLMFGGVQAMQYALAGGLVSVTLMCLLSRMKDVHPVVVSIVGGAGHNIGQVALAMLILPTIVSQLLYYMAVLMAVGMVCGTLTGVAANLVMGHIRTVPAWKRLFHDGGSQNKS